MATATRAGKNDIAFILAQSRMDGGFDVSGLATETTHPTWMKDQPFHCEDLPRWHNPVIQPRTCDAWVERNRRGVLRGQRGKPWIAVVGSAIVIQDLSATNLSAQRLVVVMHTIHDRPEAILHFVEKARVVRTRLGTFGLAVSLNRAIRFAGPDFSPTAG